MTNTIPDRFILHSELFKNIERAAISEFGKVSPEILKKILVKKINSEHNQILVDLYRQILMRIMAKQE